jgi:hypothetical protein
VGRQVVGTAIIVGGSVAGLFVDLRSLLTAASGTSYRLSIPPPLIRRDVIAALRGAEAAPKERADAERYRAPAAVMQETAPSDLHGGATRA